MEQQENNITLRKATKADIVKIVHVHSQSARDAYKGILADDMISAIFGITGLIKDWNDYLEKAEIDDNLIPLVAVEGGEIVGALRSNIAYDDEEKLLGELGYGSSDVKNSMLHYKNIYISPYHQKKGVGLSLLRAATEIAKEKGCNKAMTITLQGYDESAKFFKKTADATLLGEQTIDVGVMYKSVTDSTLHFNVWVIPNIDKVLGDNTRQINPMQLAKQNMVQAHLAHQR